MWDGGLAQVAIFDSNAGVTYPILMYGAGAGILADYNTNYDYLFVIGGDGIVLWRGYYDDAAIRTAIDQGLSALLSPAPTVPMADHRLLPGYPNPFNPSIRIPFELAGNDQVDVRLDILDLRGRKVRTLVQDRREAGRRYEVVWDGRNQAGGRLPSGAYLIRLTAGEQTSLELVTLIK